MKGTGMWWLWVRVNVLKGLELFLQPPASNGVIILGAAELAQADCFLSRKMTLKRKIKRTYYGTI